MDNSSTNFHVLLYEGLKLLGFEKYYKSNKQYSDLEFDQSTFLKGNQRAFEIVTYFLFNQLKNADFMKSFRGCYPCLDKTHESDFRKSVIANFKRLEKDPLFNYKFLPGIICNPGGDSFVSLYLAFFNYILKKTLNVDKLFETSTDELLSMIDEEKTVLMDNCMRLKDKTLKDEGYCGQFDRKFSAIRKDEIHLNAKLKEVDQDLMNRFGSTDSDELMNRVKLNFEVIRSHKLKSLFEENEEVLNTEIADIENRTINLRDFIDTSLLPVDLIEIQKSFHYKLDNLKETMKKDNSNIEEAIEKLDLKAVYYSSTNRILKELTNELEKKIDLLKHQTDEKKKVFLDRPDVQNLIKYIKSKINFNPPQFDFKPIKYEKLKPSLPLDFNLTTMDQTMANRSTDEDFNFSINLAEMTQGEASSTDESYMLPHHQTLARNYISQMPNLDNIHE